MTEREIQIALYHLAHHKGHGYFAPNIYHFPGPWESDLISVTKAGYVHEYEIKCTRSDYAADFEKSRRKIYRDKESETRHEWLTRPHNGVHKPNYFWFVMPDGMVPVDEIPEHCGVLYCVKKYGRIRLEEGRNAPRLHTEKMPKEKYVEIGRKMMYRFWKMAIETPQLTLPVDESIANETPFAQ